MAASFDDLLAMRDLDRDGVRDRFGDVGVAEDVAYEGIEDVDRLDAADPRLHFFFRGDEQQMLYVPAPTLEGTSESELEDRFGAPDATLRSRTGKTDRMLVWPQEGVAAAVGEGEIRLLEVFAPRSREAYENDIYEDPGDFIR